MRANVVFILLIAAVLPLKAAVIHGPWLGGVTNSSIKVVWITDDSSTDNTVHYGTEEQSLVSSAVTSDNVANSEIGYRHVCSLTGLQPGTLYYYRVETQNASSKVHSFLTAVNFGDPFEFVVGGDIAATGALVPWGDDISQSIRQYHNPAFLLHVGDITSGGQSWHWRDYYFKYGMDENSKYDFHCSIPWFPVAGNHEFNKENFILYGSITNPRDYSGNSDGLTFSFEYGNMVVVGADYGLEYGGVSCSDSASFMSQVFSSHADYFKVAFNHYPTYPCGGKATESQIRDNFVPACENNHAHVFFHGHDHNYQHVVRNNVHYITSGSWNTYHYTQDKWTPEDPQSQAELLKFDSDHFQYMIVYVTEDQMSVQSINSSDQTVLDSFYINLDQSWATGTGTSGPPPAATGTGNGTGSCPQTAPCASSSGVSAVFVGLMITVIIRKNNGVH